MLSYLKVFRVCYSFKVIFVSWLFQKQDQYYCYYYFSMFKLVPRNFLLSLILPPLNWLNKLTDFEMTRIHFTMRNFSRLKFLMYSSVLFSRDEVETTEIAAWTQCLWRNLSIDLGRTLLFPGVQLLRHGE